VSRFRTISFFVSLICAVSVLILVLACSAPALAQARSTPFEAGLAALGLDNNVPLAIAKIEEALKGATDAKERAQINAALGLAYEWGGRLDEAIAANRAAMAFAPDLTVDFRQYKLSLGPMGELGNCYWAKGDAAEALAWWEKALRRFPDADAITVSVVRARKQLLAAGAAIAPFVMARDLGLSGELRESEGALLVSASDLAKSIGLKLDWEQGDQQGTLSNDQHRLVFTLNKQQAELDDKPVTMTPQPTAGDDGPLVPLRFVAEAFGHHVHWDAETHIAWVE